MYLFPGLVFTFTFLKESKSTFTIQVFVYKFIVFMQYWTWYSLIWVQSHLRWHATGGSRVVFLIHSYELTFYGMTFSTVRAQLKNEFHTYAFRSCPWIICDWLIINVIFELKRIIQSTGWLKLFAYHFCKLK